MAPETIFLSVVLLGVVATIGSFASLFLLDQAEEGSSIRLVGLGVGAVAAIIYASAVILAVSPVIALMWKIGIL